MSHRNQKPWYSFHGFNRTIRNSWNAWGTKKDGKMQRCQLHNIRYDMVMSDPLKYCWKLRLLTNFFVGLEGSQAATAWKSHLRARPCKTQNITWRTSEPSKEAVGLIRLGQTKSNVFSQTWLKTANKQKPKQFCDIWINRCVMIQYKIRCDKSWRNDKPWQPHDTKWQ